MTEEIIIAGFGGQGILSLGKILAYAAMLENKEVSWMPSYGPEMRGGTANVTVIISDTRISSPVVSQYDTAIVLNQQSLDKFEHTVKKGGILIYDGNGITRHPERDDISIYRVDAAQEAARRNMSKVFNLIVLGGYMKIKPLVQDKSIEKGIANSLPARHHNLIPLNIEAYQIGKELIQKIR